ncbi:MAG: GFA family protein [Nostocaceae cyanobacterium]|nr:GFA family protein [Nostocaceae cyanobacterium]
MATSFTGGCMCGAIRYECSAEPISMGICHCRDCQRATGSAFAAALIMLRSAVTITGEVKYHGVTGDSGNLVKRGFCPHCGSRLFGTPANPDLISIQAGSLDDPSWFKPQAEIYTGSAQPWDYMNPDLPKFTKLPPLNKANVTD